MSHPLPLPRYMVLRVTYLESIKMLGKLLPEDWEDTGELDGGRILSKTSWFMNKQMACELAREWKRAGHQALVIDQSEHVIFEA